MKKNFYFSSIFAVCLLTNTGIVNATNGTQLTGFSALQKGTAGAGIASAKDSTWVITNPASIINLQKRTDISIELFAPDRYMTPDGPPGLANSAAGKQSDDSVFYIPTVGMVFPHEYGTVGLGIYGINGMGVNYAQSRTTIGAAGGFDRRTEYAVAKAAIAYAYPISNTLTVGAALNLDYARFRADAMTLANTQTAGRFQWDDAFGIGFQLGIHKQFYSFSLAASYTSPQWMQRFDKYKDLLKDSVDLPQTFQMGIAYQATPNIEIVADYKFLNWKGVRLMGDAPVTGGYGWDNQHVFSLGATWAVDDHLTLRSGINYGKSPIAKDVVFANALFPAITELHIAAGASYVLSNRSEMHFTYMHVFENELTDSGTGDNFSVFGEGTKIGLGEDTFTLGLSYLF